MDKARDSYGFPRRPKRTADPKLGLDEVGLPMDTAFWAKGSCRDCYGRGSIEGMFWEGATETAPGRQEKACKPCRCSLSRYKRARAEKGAKCPPKPAIAAQETPAP